FRSGSHCREVSAHCDGRFPLLDSVQGDSRHVGSLGRRGRADTQRLPARSDKLADGTQSGRKLGRQFRSRGRHSVSHIKQYKCFVNNEKRFYDGFMTLSDSALQTLAQAKRLLENPGLAVKLANVVGKPIEKGFEMLPPRWRDQVGEITHKALDAA